LTTLTVLASLAAIGTLCYALLIGTKSLPELLARRRRRRETVPETSTVAVGQEAAIGQPPAGGSDPTEDLELTRRILTQVRSDMALIQLRGLAPGSAHKLRLPLQAIYVPTMILDTREEPPPSLTVEPSTGLLTREEQQIISLSRVLNDTDHLLVLGAAGLGKTTFLRYVSFVLATAILDNTINAVKDNLGIDWPKAPIPVYLPLREVGYRFERSRHDGMVEGDPDAVVDCFANGLDLQPTEAVAAWLRRNLTDGNCLVLFDGLDEVIDTRTRDLVDEAIDRFIRRYPRNRYVVTARPEIMGRSTYFEGSFTECKIQLLRSDEIRQFVRNWYVALHQNQPQPQRYTVETEVAELMRAIDSDESVRELAVSPMILTIIAAMHYARNSLPHRRVELYDQCTLALCGEWDQAKPGPAAKSNQWYHQDSLMSASTRRIQLEYVAEYLQDKGHPEAGVAELARWLAQCSPPFQSDDGEQAAEVFLRGIAMRGGILEAHHNQRYGFAYPVFQSYLCARRIARNPQRMQELLNHSGDPHWRSTIRLVAGHLSSADPERAQAIIEAVLAAGEPDVAGQARTAASGARAEAEEMWSTADSLRIAAYSPAATLLAGECIEDSDRSGLGAPLQQRVCLDLTKMLTDGSLTESARCRAGLLLGNLDGAMPDHESVVIPAKTVWIGSSRHPNELPVHEVELASFRLARYPVTNQDYARFIADEGYRQSRVWTEAGWSWRESGQVSQPFHWDDPKFCNPRQPVVGVSWFEAMAYATWSGARLPTEAEWEGALACPPDWPWPWGEEFRPGACNTAMSGLGKPSPVGMYPESRSSEGTDDMLGNVWEWCSSRYRPYPYESGSTREEAGGEDARVLRGGSWYGPAEEARPAERRWLHPGARQFNFGFRLAW
jgi:formylglycine-generating enzyme required for sulfatase activity/energy-coupling factor transporter ATP-binding protein EcfA2